MKISLIVCLTTHLYTWRHANNRSRDSSLNQFTPILGVSGIADEDNKSLYLEAGMNDVFTKPMKLDVYQMIVNQYLKAK